MAFVTSSRGRSAIGLRPLVQGRSSSSVSTGGGGGGFGGEAPVMPKPKPYNRELMGSPFQGSMPSNIIDPTTGRRRSVEDAINRGPYTIQGWNSGRGRYGYGGGGFQRPTTPIGSAGVAGGTPTSQRGRFELAMEADPTLDPDKAWMAADQPSWDQPRPDPFKPNPRYGNMGRPPVRSYADGTKDSGKKPEVAVVGEDGPEAMILPPHSKVIPLTDSAWGESAIEEVMGGPPDGEIRLDEAGNEWRYDAKQGRGIPVNPYLYGRENAPAPRDRFTMSAVERYQDLADRLSSLRQSGFAEGRAAVGRLKGQQAEEQAAREAFLATGKPIVPEEGGGTLYRTPHGNAIVGSNRPRSFTVENFEGGQTASGDLAEVDRESRADAAERTVRGRSTRDYRAMPGAAPTVIEEDLPSAIDDVIPGPPPPRPRPPAPRVPWVGDAYPTAVGDVLDRPLGKPPTVDQIKPMVKSILESSEDTPEAASKKARESAFSRVSDSRDSSVSREGAPSEATEGKYGGVLPDGSTKNMSRLDKSAWDLVRFIGGIADEVGVSTKRVYDYIFSVGGTDRDQSKATQDKMNRELEKRGWDVLKDAEGNIKTILRRSNKNG